MKTLLILFTMLLMSCSTSTYLVSIHPKGERLQIYHFESEDSVRSIIQGKTGLEINVGELLSDSKKTYFEFTNSDLHIYVQKK